MINQIEELLKDFPGYCKEGASRLQKVVKRKLDLDVTKEECRQAVRNVNNKLRNVNTKLRNKEFEYPDNYQEIISDLIKDNEVYESKEENLKIPKGFKIKSKWQNAKGEWLMSLKPNEDIITEDLESDLISIFSDIVSEITEKVDIVKPLYHSNLNKDLKVWTSDKHIGATGSEDNEYSAKEFERRMDIIYLSIEDMVARQGSFETITVADLGDALDGMDGFTVSRHHRLKQNMNNKEAFETYFRVHKKFFDKLFKSGFAKNYQLWSITNANHDGDFFHVANAALFAYINGVYPEVKTQVLDNFMNHINHNGIDYVLTHGKDKENRFKGLPLFPTPQAETFIEAFLKRKDIPRQARVRVIKGDLHQYCTAPCKNVEVYKTVPSIFGTSEWILDNFELTDAGCAYEILDLLTEDILEGVIKFK